MALIKPTIGKVRPPDDPKQQFGPVYNFPRFLKFGGLDGAKRFFKNIMNISDRGGGKRGPFGTGSV